MNGALSAPVSLLFFRLIYLVSIAPGLRLVAADSESLGCAQDVPLGSAIQMRLAPCFTVSKVRSFLPIGIRTAAKLFQFSLANFHRPIYVFRYAHRIAQQLCLEQRPWPELGN
jgi:hypothetical protein